MREATKAKLFADFLRSYRQERRLSQEQLAAQVGKTQQTVSRWESGKIVPPPEAVPELARKLRVPQDDLMSEIIESSLHRMRQDAARGASLDDGRSLDERVEALERQLKMFGRQLDTLRDLLEALRDQRG